MPDLKGRFTSQELVFIETFLETGNRAGAAREAGYVQPSRDAGRVLSRPEVQAEIGRRQVERLFSEALPAAVGCLIAIVGNTSAPAGARVQAAKVIMDRTIGQGDAANGKEPHEMTGEELARAIAELERIAADKAKVVSPPPAADILG